ncbi:PilZ domain-containing protein [Candidatus Eisenbacteria bacterium]|uniref:PilZ domain-containing protein n=1 Tax=Eiseniibacteriota bacterium TaxID=2212470 RepID=A0ABV6YLY6_UNCEI
MRSPISPERIAELFQRGTSVRIVLPEIGRADLLDARIRSIEESTCALLAKQRDHVRTPDLGEFAELIHYTPDGIIHVWGTVEEWHVETDATGGADSASIRLRLDLPGARIEQRRAFFRVDGLWPAMIRARAVEGDVPATIRQLSAGSAIVEDLQNMLGRRAEFSLMIHLEDFGPPVWVEAHVVRYVGSSRNGSELWACAFLGHDPRLEDYLADYLQTLTRLRSLRVGSDL